MKKIVYTFLATALFFSCERDDIGVVPTPPVSTPPEVVVPVDYTSGSANFSTFVAVGNSLTAGYSDRALFREGQENSTPNMLAQQMQLAGGGSFDTPYMNDNLGGLLLGGQVITNNRMFLDFSSGTPTPNFKSGTPTTEVTNTLSGNFNNMGVPGAKSYHLVAPGYGNVAGVAAGLANPYYARFASSPGATVIGDAAAQAPSFFSLWIGNNDILGFATSGGAGVDQTGNLDPSTYGGSDITDPNVFASVYSGLLDVLTSTATGGVVNNIPSVVDIPFFTTVPYAPLTPDALAGQVELLNQVYGALNGVYAFAGVEGRDISFSSTAANPVVVFDEELADMGPTITAVLGASPEFALFVQSLGLPAQAVPLVAQLMGDTYGQSRQATPEDMLVFTTATVIGTVNEDRATQLVLAGLSPEMAGTFSVEGVTLPMEDKWVLTPEEQTMIENARVQYNAAIEALAAAHNLAFYDAAADLNELNNGGITMNGITSTGVYATGGAFSLDGVHPSPRGYSIIANGMIDVINAKYGSNLPKVDVGNYKGVYVD